MAEFNYLISGKRNFFEGAIYSNHYRFHVRPMQEAWFFSSQEG